MATIEKPEMPLLRETPDEIFQRMVNRANAYAELKGNLPPATEEGEIFYDMWYPLAEEISEQQQLNEYAFLQGFVIWADGEYLEVHGYEDGVDLKDGEDIEEYRDRILDERRSEKGNGRAEDYASWALDIEGVGGAVPIEHERNDVSIDLFLTDMNDQPVTPDYALFVRSELERKRWAGHDLQCFPAEIFPVTVQVQLTLSDESKREAAIALITQRQKDYLKKRSTIVYQQLGALFWVDGVSDYSNFTLNGGTANLDKPIKSVSVLNLVILS